MSSLLTLHVYVFSKWQVHDELVFEVEAAAVDEVSATVSQLMSDVGAQLDVPLTVNVGVGRNWDEAH